MKATLISLTILFSAGCSLTYAQTIVTTIAGTNLVSGYTGDGGPGTAATLTRAMAVAADNAGNVYIADYFNHAIRKVDINGIITTVAGNGTAGYGGNGGPATSAQLSYPNGVAVDKAGNLYITDDYAAVRKVNTSGIISIYAGMPTVSGYSGDGGPAALAKLGAPRYLAVDNANNLYIMDGGYNTVRKVSPSGIISTFIGIGQLTSGSGALAADNFGNVYIAALFGHVILKANAAGAITTIAGTGAIGIGGNGGPAINATFTFPSGITVDNAGNIYVIDENNPTVRKIDATTGIITKFAFDGSPGYGGDGGPGLAAEMWIPYGIATDYAGHFYVADMYSYTVRKVTACVPVVFNQQPSNISICEKANTTFSVFSLNADTYQWQVNDGSGWNNITDGGVYSGALTNTLTISQAAMSMNNYQYRCYATNACNNNYSSAASLTVAIRPTITITGPQITACQGSTVVFTATPATGSNPALQWQVNEGSGWNNITGNSTYSGALTNTLTINQAAASMTNYQYRCTAINACSTEQSSVALLTVLTPATVSIGTSATNVCSGSPVTFTATTTNGTAQWQVNDGSGWNNIADNSTYSGALTNTLTISHAVASMTNYQYRCAATNTCSTNYSSAGLLTVTATPAPAITIAASTNDVCSGTPVTFTATTTNGGTKPMYQWQVNGANAGNNSADYTSGNLSDGDIISCIFTSSLTCASPVTSTNNIVMIIKPVPAVSVTADTTIKQGNTVQLNALATGAINTYQWSPATDLSDQNISNPTTKPVNTITYQVTATSTDGCAAYGKVTITVLKKIVLPNAFTPNGDGRNDVFRIPAGISFNLKTFSIFDRWGNMVFQTNDIAQGWNGTFNGQPANVGTYVYMITGSSQNENVALKGTVELIR